MSENLPKVCGYPFDTMVCVAPREHEGPHITSNERFPHGLPRADTPVTGRPAVAALRAEWKQGLREGGHMSDRTVQFVERLLAVLEAESPTTLREAAQRLRTFIRAHRTGGCRAMSVGSACECPLCDVDRLDDGAGAALREPPAPETVTTKCPKCGAPAVWKEHDSVIIGGAYDGVPVGGGWRYVEGAGSPQTGTAPSKVTRFEVIDHRHGAPEVGRAFVVWNAAIELSYQDAGRTLKVFVDDATTGVPDRELDDNEAAAEDATWD